MASPFQYFISLTGDCSNTNSGVISISFSGGTPPYSVQWVSPSLGLDVVTLNPSVRTGLTTTTYGLYVVDSTLPLNLSFPIDIPISSGVCATIETVVSTTCGLDNGSVVATSSSDYSSTNFYLYDFDGNYITSAITDASQVTFLNLSAGTYYTTALDLGGCTGQSQTFIIEDSTPLEYGLYVVPNSSCGGSPIGKIYVTGVTGTPPYTYLWNNGQTGSTITGLTSGSYSVQVTDDYGCTDTKTGTIVNVDPIGFGQFTVTQPTCFSADGSFTLQITGGTAPYYYSASTGNVTVQYGTSWTVSGLSPGSYSVLVTDAAFCTLATSVELLTPEGLSSVNITSQGSTCSSTDGLITVSINGGVGPYTYTLIYPDTNTSVFTTYQTTYSFINLQSGTYTVVVADSSGCFYSSEITLYATNNFTISTQVTGATCSGNNGVISVTKTNGGLSPYTYLLDNNNSISSSFSAVTFTSIPYGQHTISVTDATGCTQTTNVFVNGTSQVNFNLYETSCGSGSDGAITAFISSGVPPFNYNWSDNVPGNPQQITVSGLTGGTYSLTLIDSNGCSLKRDTIIACDATISAYEIYPMGGQLFEIIQTQFGLQQMLNQGYDQLTSGRTDCSLISATYSLNVYVEPSGISGTTTFYTSTSVTDIPADNLYYDAAQSLLLSVPGVQNVIVNPILNEITIQSSTTNNELIGKTIILKLFIDYNIICLS
jgi:hypothetical protein